MLNLFSHSVYWDCDGSVSAPIYGSFDLYDQIIYSPVIGTCTYFATPITAYGPGLTSQVDGFFVPSKDLSLIFSLLTNYFRYECVWTGK